jgi:acyl-CoA synthetase (AMP-forming)/AMP-acid ligase II
MTDVVTTILAQGAQRPDDVAIVGVDGSTTTYRALCDQLLAVRHGLRADGLRDGDGVLFAMRGSAPGFAVFLGILAAGGVVIAADSAVGPELFSARLRVSAPKWVIAESALYPASVFGPLRSLARRRGWALPDLRATIIDAALHHVYSGRRWPGVPRGARSLRGFGSGQVTDALPAPDPDAPALVVFTSGTTSRPRGVLHSRGTLAAAVTMLGEQILFRPGDVMHVEGIVAGLPALAAGATVSLPGPRFAAELVQRRVTHVYGVPVHLSETLRVAPRWPGHVRYVLMGSAPAAPDVLRRAIAAAPAAQVLSVYAMTEAIPLAIASAADKLAHLGSGDLLGRPVPGVGVRIAEDGELLVTGPNVCVGYLGDGPTTELRTGDLARLDRDGRVILLGRKKDMLIRGSYNIYPGLYEPSIAALPGVREAAMVGLPDPVTRDEAVVLAVVAETGADAGALPGRLHQLLPDVIDAEAVPDRIVVLDELPRSGRSRKLDRAALRVMVSGGAG